MYHYVLFDLDGTLTDPKEGICKSVQYALHDQNIEEPDLDKLEPFIGPPLLKSFQEFYGMDEEQAKAAVAKYRERFEKIGLYENELYPGMKEFLVSLRKKGVHLAVASSKPQEFVEKILKHFEIRKYFRIVTGSEKDGRRSEKKEVIEETLSKLFGEKEVPGKEVLMVGDRKFDVEGAKAFGLECAGVSYGYGTQEELLEAGASYITDNLEELFYIITGERKQDVEGKISGWQKSVRILCPVVYAYALSQLCLFFLQALWMLLSKGSLSQYGGLGLMDSKQVIVYMDGISALFCTFVFAGIYKKEKQRPISHVVKRRNDRKLIKDLPCLIMFGIGAAFFLNLLIMRMGLMGLSGTYQETADIQYLVPLAIGLVNYGILQPIEEELVYRGLVYDRMRRFFSARLSIPVSAIIFGACHGNIVQLLYGFFMGCILAWSYENYKSLKASFILHGAVNVVIYLVSGTKVFERLLYDGRSLLAAGLITVVSGILLARRNLAGKNFAGSNITRKNITGRNITGRN